MSERTWIKAEAGKVKREGWIGGAFTNYQKNCLVVECEEKEINRTTLEFRDKLGNWTNGNGIQRLKRIGKERDWWGLEENSLTLNTQAFVMPFSHAHRS